VLPRRLDGTNGIGVEVALDIADDLHPYGGPGGWNDLDMLVVGLKGKGQISGGGLSFIEYQTHMSMWCMACSPLMIGCDVRAMDEETAALYDEPRSAGREPGCLRQACPPCETARPTSGMEETTRGWCGGADQSWINGT
jgi:hypothetical protein